MSEPAGGVQVRRITLRDAARWRRTPEQISDLARRMIQREVLVTNDPEAVRCAFLMPLALVQLTRAASERVGALIGDHDAVGVVPGRALNGWPMFLGVGFLHRDDVPAFDAEVDRMLAALGTPRAPAEPSEG